jgi:Xaa-Pro dipeptidase
VKEPGFYGAIRIEDGITVLFMPRHDESYKIWCGEIYPPSYFQSLYGVDEVLHIDDMKAWLANEVKGENSIIHILSGINADSGKSPAQPDFDGFPEFKSAGKVSECEPSLGGKTSALYQALSTARVIKSADEVDVMQYCAVVASNAHVEVMRQVKTFQFEFEVEAKFLYEIYSKGGCRKSAYISICGCGPNAAVLHYGHAAAPNDRHIGPNELVLFDMGAEYHGYVSDITCSYPVSGKFSNDQRIVYEAVLNAQRAVYAIMRPGVSWTDCHLAAEREIVRALADAGLFHNGTLEEYIEAHLGPVFFPHGLGHLIGCDTHDVGGYIHGTPEKPDRPGLAKLRTARVLENYMVLTNEPGCYFIDALLDAAFNDESKARFMNREVIERFRGTGGVRLEDVVLVTYDGPQSLSTCPRLIEEIEDVMAGGQWPPAVDKAPELKRRWSKLSGDTSCMVDYTVDGSGKLSL